MGVPVTVGLIENNCFADRVEVYSRRGLLLYANELVQRVWSQNPQGVAVIQAERNRCPTADETQQRETAWITILTMMAARRAAESEIQIARDLAETYLHCEYQANGRSYRDEILQRLNGLAVLERATGTAHNLWKIANKAKCFTSNPDCIDWHAIDREVAIKSISKHQQNPERVTEVLCKYSPGTVSLAGKAVALDIINRLALE